MHAACRLAIFDVVKAKYSGVWGRLLLRLFAAMRGAPAAVFRGARVGFVQTEPRGASWPAFERDRYYVGAIYLQPRHPYQKAGHNGWQACAHGAAMWLVFRRNLLRPAQAIQPNYPYLARIYARRFCGGFGALCLVSGGTCAFWRLWAQLKFMCFGCGSHTVLSRRLNCQRNIKSHR